MIIQKKVTWNKMNVNWNKKHEKTTLYIDIKKIIKSQKHTK